MTKISMDLGADKDDSLPKPPTIAPEMQKTIDAEQKKMASRFDLSPGARQLARARAVIAESAPIPIDDLSPRQKEHYADALAVLGNFTLAAEISGNERYMEIAKAITNTECDCKDFETTELKDDKPVAVKRSRLYKKQSIYVDGAWKALTACNICGNLTVK